jgi:prepilin-type N-terminal cleavage/methylation domain-containing protein
MMKQRSQKGFTLVELMVVVAIIAILSVFLFGVSGRQYGANPMAVSDKIAATMNWVKMRAVATRRIQTVEVKPNEILIWQSDITGFAASAGTPQFVQRISIPANVSIWQVDGIAHASTGNSVSQNTALDVDITFKPDGSSSGATMYVTDMGHHYEYRVLIYKFTGASYARQTW